MWNNNENGKEFILTGRRFAEINNLISLATEHFEEHPEQKEFYQYDYLQILKKGLQNYSMVKKFKDSDEEFLSVKLYPRQMEAFIELALDFGVFFCKERHKEEELEEYIKRIKKDFPNKVWKDYKK